jgi:cytochrome c oxidase subunit 4
MSHHSADTHHDAHHDELAHPLPLKLLFGVFGWLMVFTFLTVAATWIDLGNFNIVLALAIAVIKAILVCLYFMHLRYENPFYSMVLVTSLAFVGLFMGVALIDTHQYEPNVQSRLQEQLKAAAAEAGVAAPAATDAPASAESSAPRH